MNRMFLLLEVISILAAIIFGVIWYNDPSGNWEPLTVLFAAVVPLLELRRRTFSSEKAKRRFKTNGDRIRHREQLRKELQEEVYRCRAEKLRKDIIIRHVDRVDDYPNLKDDDAGISPWFRIALLDTYERGINVGLRYGDLKEINGGYRFVDHANNEEGDVRAILMGDIPYDSIEAVNMEGDDYYHYPHIYCHFDFEEGPYERLWLCLEIDQPHGHPYYKHIADYQEVIDNSPDEGEFYFG